MHTEQTSTLNRGVIEHKFAADADMVQSVHAHGDREDSNLVSVTRST